MMSTKITPDHLGRIAVVYIRQSTMAQVLGNLESQRRQYDLARAAKGAGFVSVTVIDDDLGRSGSGSMQRPGFERLVALVCSGDVGAVYCIEASRLARNGRDWHHLIDLCALAGALVVDPDGAYDPRLVNDRLLLGLKGTMSEYELSLMRQRGLAARDAKARRGEHQFMLPPGFCWSEAGKIEIDPDEHVADTIRLVFTKFHELGSARQVFLWLRAADIKMPVVLRNVDVYKLVWKAPAYHSVMQILHRPLYAGAYAFGRRAQRTRIVDGRAHKTSGMRKPREGWNVLLRDNHPAYISWQDYEDNQKLLLENAYMKKNCARKSARGGRALLTGLMRCGRCGRMMRVFYGMGKGNAHRYQCRGDDAHVGAGLCIGIGGIRVDRAIALQILEAVSDRAVEAAIFASDQVERSRKEVMAAVERELEAARYDASLASRRYELVDPAKRHVARELEARWNGAWSAWMNSRAKLPIYIRHRRQVQRSTVHFLSILLAICPRLGTRLRPTRVPSSVSSIFWFRKLSATSTKPATKLCSWCTGPVGATPRFVSPESKPADTPVTWRRRPSMRSANSLGTGRIVSSPCRSIECVVKPMMARPGRRFGSAKCANVSAYPNMSRPTLESK
jgi:DNA invertase Pin-like site-specific DNA recombinase